ncbi:response regulator [Aurantimonas aggregata]|uniref:Response regulator n=1 Tax=Aurantimonas aggregata TaxID=2047720 RepID=A0A6L9MMJ8_9HYPH|nr:response regulator [Aurantimonas aggregata]NDV88951.1 response regulator [Aurantimonas aggregata]
MSSMLVEASVDFSGRSILIIEDEALIAMEMQEAVEAAGGTVLGPVPSVQEAMALISAGRAIDAAILDIRLTDGISIAVAQRLKSSGVPLIFVTGYDGWHMPDDLEDVPVYQKPNDPENVVRVLFDTWRRVRT